MQVNNPHPNVFNLMSNLLGNEPEKIKIEKNTIEINAAIAKIENCNDESLPTMAVYPAIIGDAFKNTMDGYRKFVALKNFTFKEDNLLINQYNQNVWDTKFCRVDGKIVSKPLTDIQVAFSELFIKKNSKKQPEIYNNLVDDFNKQYGMLVRKKKLQTIKPTAELVFQNIICIYNQQLMIKNNRYIAHNITTKTPLEPCKVNSWKVTELKRNGIKSLDFCKKTIQAHVSRFLDFGVFTHYKFNGVNRPIELHINKDILALKDLFNDKLVKTENQRVTSQKENIVTQQNEKITRTLVKESKNEKKVDNFSSFAEFPAVTPFVFSFTGTPTSKMKNANLGGADSQKNIQNNLSNSDILLKTLVDDGKFAEQLTACEFNNYKPIDIRILYQEATKGTLSRSQFFEIAMIDTLKSLQKNIYRTPNKVFFGSWYNTIQQFKLQRWNSFTGQKHNPVNMVDYVSEYRWRIQWARKWFFKNPNFNPLFPNQYLDVTRKSSKEVGFEYTKEKYKQQIADNKKYNDLQKKQELDAKNRGIVINNNKKLETQLNRFFKNKITLSQLYDYVEKNLPKQFRDDLANRIELKNLQINEKTFVVKYSIEDF